MKGLSFPAIGAAIILGATAASAQGLPASTGANTDPTWSISQHAQRPDAHGQDHDRGLIKPSVNLLTNNACTCADARPGFAVRTVADRPVY